MNGGTGGSLVKTGSGTLTCPASTCTGRHHGRCRNADRERLDRQLGLHRSAAARWPAPARSGPSWWQWRRLRSRPVGHARNHDCGRQSRSSPAGSIACRSIRRVPRAPMCRALRRPAATSGALCPGSSLTRQQTILHTGGLCNTEFCGVTTNLPGLAASLSYTPTDVLLNLTAGLGLGGRLSQNQQNVADSLNSYFNNGGALPPNFVAIFGLTGGNLGNSSRAHCRASPRPGRSRVRSSSPASSSARCSIRSSMGRSRGANGPALGFARSRETARRCRARLCEGDEGAGRHDAAGLRAALERVGLGLWRV